MSSSHARATSISAKRTSATGGCVLHHLKAYTPGAKDTILFKIHGACVPVRAEVANLEILSAVVDRTAPGSCGPRRAGGCRCIAAGHPGAPRVAVHGA
jgi:hypothetical protein